MKDLKKSVVESLKKGRKSINQICNDVGINDDFAICGVISELENSGEAVFDGFTKAYHPNANVIYISNYKYIGEQP